VNSRNHLLDPASNPASDAVGERTGQLRQAIHQLRSQTLRGQRVYRLVRQLLHVDVGQDLGADLISQRGLTGLPKITGT
jgi:hypothetical protein